MAAQEPDNLRSIYQKSGLPADRALLAIRKVINKSSELLSQHSDRISLDHLLLDGTLNLNLDAPKSVYLAPEIRLAGNESGERAAVFSIGVCLFELLTGNLPEERPYAQDVISDVRDAVVANGASGFGVNDLAITVSHLLNPDPYERYESLADVERALDHVKSFSEAKPEPSGGVDKPLTPVSDMIRGFEIGAAKSDDEEGAAQHQKPIDPAIIKRERPPDSKRGIRWNTPDFDSRSRGASADESSTQSSAQAEGRKRKNTSDRIELKLRKRSTSLRERLGWKGVQLQGDKNEGEEQQTIFGGQKPSSSKRQESGNLDIESSMRRRGSKRASDRFSSGQGLLSGMEQADSEDSVPFVWDVLVVNFLLTLSIGFFISAVLIQCLDRLPIRQIMISGLSQDVLLLSDRAVLMVVLVAMLGLPMLALMAAASSAWRALFAWSQQVAVMLVMFAIYFKINLMRLSSIAGQTELDPLAHMDAARAALANMVEIAALAPRLSVLTTSNRFAVPVFTQDLNFAPSLELANISLIGFMLLVLTLIISRQQRLGLARAIRGFVLLLGLIFVENLICVIVVFLNLPLLSDSFELLPQILGIQPPVCVVAFAVTNLIFGWILIARHARLRLRADNASWLSSLKRSKSLSANSN